MGSAVIVDLAKKLDMAGDIFLSSIKLNSDEKIKNLKIPKLFIHSIDDLTVPFNLGLKLYNLALEPKEFLKVTGTHSN